MTMLDGGLNRVGHTVSFWLNPRFNQIVPKGELGHVKVYVISDGTVTLFADVPPAYDPMVSTYHHDDGEQDGFKTTPSGVGPAPNPPPGFHPEESGGPAGENDGVEVNPFVPSGTLPQADPAPGFQAKESEESSEENPGSDTVQTPSSGTGPAPDPDVEFVDKDSGSETDT